MIRKEEETISMTMEEYDKQQNQIEINDNKLFNKYSISIENDEKMELLMRRKGYVW